MSAAAASSSDKPGRGDFRASDLREQLDKVVDQTKHIVELQRDVKNLSEQVQAVLAFIHGEGGGNADKGFIVRMDRMEQFAASNRKLISFIIGVIGAIIGGVIVYKITH